MEPQELKDLRTKSGLKQREVANHLKVSRAWYAKMELGIVGIPIKHLIGLIELFGLDVEDYDVLSIKGYKVVKEAGLC